MSSPRCLGFISTVSPALQSHQHTSHTCGAISKTSSSSSNAISIAKLIDHTNLKPSAQSKDIIKLCDEALRYNFFSVCIHSSHIPLAKRCLETSSDVKICTVIGFPSGAVDSKTKSYETQKAVESGAAEVDMVVHLGAIKDRDLEYVTNDIRGVVDAAKSVNPSTIVKVILECSELSDEEKVLACRCAVTAGANFVKTSTGFSKSGATVSDIRLMANEVCGKGLQVKASGGVRTLQSLQDMVQAGASRIGTSNGTSIIAELSNEQSPEMANKNANENHADKSAY